MPLAGLVVLRAANQNSLIAGGNHTTDGGRDRIRTCCLPLCLRLHIHMCFSDRIVPILPVRHGGLSLLSAKDIGKEVSFAASPSPPLEPQTGLEPASSRLGTVRSGQLSYCGVSPPFLTANLPVAWELGHSIISNSRVMGQFSQMNSSPISFASSR